MSEPKRRDMSRANEMLSREARLEDVITVAQLLAERDRWREMAECDLCLPGDPCKSHSDR